MTLSGANHPSVDASRSACDLRRLTLRLMPSAARAKPALLGLGYRNRRRLSSALARRRCDGHLDDEGRPVRSVRLHPDPAVDPAEELAADVEAEAGAADAASHVRVEAVELLEDAALLGGRDAETGVGHDEANVPSP